MFQRATIVAAIVMIMCAYVGTANGKAKKIKFFTPELVQVDESKFFLGDDADPDGMAILNYITPLDKTIVQIIVSDMTPNLTYSVRLTGCTPEDVLLDPLVTDEDGNGTLHQEHAGDISTCDVELFVGTTASGVVWSQPPDNAVIQFNSTTKTHLVPPGSTSLLADDFHFDSDQQIDRVRWWGGSCSLAVPISTFRIRIHQDDGGGKPSTFFFEQNNVDPDDIPTGATMDCSGAQFQFETDLSSPFIAQGGATYFFAVAAVAPDGETFFAWNGADATAPDANGDSFTASGTTDIDPSSWSGTSIDQAFELVGTTDTLQLRASGINPG